MSECSALDCDKLRRVRSAGIEPCGACSQFIVQCAECATEWLISATSLVFESALAAMRAAWGERDAPLGTAVVVFDDVRDATLALEGAGPAHQVVTKVWREAKVIGLANHRARSF